jgi:DNA invertase Pin-like site-specific DNA recombinase
MITGYARVSSLGQKLSTQVQKLKDYGCERIYKEKLSGKSTTQRDELRSALLYVREGDCLVVCKLDRLARSAVNLGCIAEELRKKKVDLIVLDQNIDTTSPTGKLMFTMIGAFAEFERDLIRERCAEGIAKAVEKGVKFGRKSKLTPKQINKMKAEFDEGEISKALLANKYGISRASLYRLVKS